MKTKKIRIYGNIDEKCGYVKYTKIFDVNGKPILKLNVSYPDDELIGSVCERYAGFVENKVFPKLKNDFENCGMERKYLRYPCSEISAAAEIITEKNRSAVCIIIRKNINSIEDESVPVKILYKTI